VQPTYRGATLTTSIWCYILCSFWSPLGMRMPAWFDLSTLSSLTDSSSDDEPGLLSSVSSVESLIQSEIDAGIPAEKIVVGGFSQGGAVAWLLGLTTPRKLAGVGCLSTWVVLGHKIEEVSGASSREELVRAE
jgi:predicted esterase